MSTSGPWNVSRSSECIVIGHDGYQIATTDCDPSLPYDEHYERHAANAQLIASAPDLLEVLKEAANELFSLPASSNALLRRVRAVIAKAEGQS